MSLFEPMRDTDHHLLIFEGMRSDPARLEAALEELKGLLDRYEASIGVLPVYAGNRKLHVAYGAKEPTVCLVRPDGHIAYRGGAADVVRVKMYLDRLFVRRETGERVSAVSRQELDGTMTDMEGRI